MNKHMNKQSLDERIFDLPIVNEAYVDASAVKQLIRDVITEVTDIETTYLSADETIDQVHTNLNNLLGEKR